MGKTVVVVALVLGFGARSRADEPDLVADRPGFGESASVVGTGRVQAETGVTWTRVNSSIGVLDLPEATVRVGLSRDVEVRVTTPDWVETRDHGASSGWSDMAVGLKGHVAVGQNDLSLRGTVTLPTGSEPLTTDRVEPDVAIAWNRPLSARWSLGATVSAHRFRQLHETLTSPSVSLGRALGEHVATFVEYGANLAREAHAIQKIDHGYTWLVNPHTQLDGSVGVGLSASAPDFFVEVGFCRRF